MRIAFNPSTVKALIAPPNNKDITFDLRGQNIFARGVKFCGTDTNTWRDIKINNVSIDSNTLDLRDGDNTTLTNINGVVTINSTWRPVVDNLTSDSTTSSLSANLGRVLKALIDDKSDSDHNHDDRYLRLTGGTISGRLLVNSDSNSYTTPSIAINYYDSYTVNDYSITQIKMGNPKYDMYLGLSPAVKGRYGKIGYFMHADTDCEFLWGTSGWIKRMALECSSGNLWVSGSITAGKFHSNASASTDLTVIPPDTAIALETGNGNGVVNSWIWRENYTSSNWGIFHNNSEDDSINFVGNNRIRVKISLGSNSLKVGGTEVSLEGHNHDDRYVKKSGDTMFGALNFANGTWNLVGDDSYMGDCNVSGHFGIKAANTTYPGIAFFNNANDHLGNLTAYNGNIKYGAYSLQFLDNGNTSVSAGSWMNPFNTYNASAVTDGQAVCVWGQSSYLSNLAADSGDMSLWLKRVNANVATLNMVLDGEYYANGNLRLAHVSEIPNSLKNPYSLTTFGVVYDGSAAKVVGPSNFINLLEEGTSIVTDGTMFITSWASDNGFADTNAVNVPYKRKAIHLWEYIKAKTDSLYAVIEHNHDDRYLKLTGGTMSGTLSFSPTDSSDAAPKIYSTVSDSLTSLNFEVSDDAEDRFVFKINYYNDTNSTNRERFTIDWNNVISKAPITAPSFNGNAISATKLQTSRLLWGQSFDGTGDVDGTLRIRQTTSNWCEGIRIQNGDNTWATIILGATSDTGTNANAWSIHRKDDNNFAIARNGSDGVNGLVMTSVGMGLGTTAPTHRLDVRGDTKITGSIRDLAIGGGIYWNPYVESTTDGSDAASITLVKSGIAGGTTLVLSLMNDANDTILFQTNGSARLYHNSYPILTTLNTYVSNNKGYINGTEITLVNNANYSGSTGKLTSLGDYTYDNLSKDIPTNAVSYKIISSGGTDLGDSQYNVLHIPWSSGDWGMYLLFGANNGRFGIKYKHSGIVREILDSSNYTSYAIPTSASCNKNWSYSGQSGQPTWLWGSNDGTNCYVWNPSNFSVNYANSANSSNRTKFLETFRQDSTTDTYGTSYPIWAQWANSTNVRLKCTNYTVWTDKADYATSAGNADTVDGYHASSLLTSVTNTNNGISVTVGGTTKSVSNISVNYAASAGNADKVDGYHSSSFLTKHTREGAYNIDHLTDFVTRDLQPKSEINIEGTKPYDGWGIVTVLKTDNGTAQLVFDGGSNMYFRSSYGSEHRYVTSAWKQVANLSSNVASATKLQTPRNIWGQSFDGTRDVNGTIYINNSDSSNGAIRLNNNRNSNARISAISDQVIFNTGSAIRFGETDWDFNQWAGLKYTHSNKTIYLGIADNSIFNANSTLSGGTLNLRAGISSIDLNSGTSIRGLATNGSPYASYINLYDTSISLSTYGDISMSTGPGAIKLTSGYSGIKLSCLGNNASVDSGGFKVEASRGVYLNSGNSGNVYLCLGGGNVSIGYSSPSYKLDVNGLVRASGFIHSGHSINDAVLLAGGGYERMFKLGTEKYYNDTSYELSFHKLSGLFNNLVWVDGSIWNSTSTSFYISSDFYPYLYANSPSMRTIYRMDGNNMITVDGNGMVVISCSSYPRRIGFFYTGRA